MRRIELWTAGLISLGLLVVAGSGPRTTTCAQEGEDASADGYAGSKSCKKCHLPQFRSWSETHMAKSFSLLAPGERAEVKRAKGLDPQKDYRRDEACLECHVVGLGKPGGFTLDYDAAKDKDLLLGVGCESCHGPGRALLAKGRKDREYADHHDERLKKMVDEQGYVPKPGEAVCQRCHNEKSPTFKAFEYEKRKAEGIHAHPEKGK